MSPLPLPAVGAPAARALASLGVVTLDDAARFTEAELLALHGFGAKALQILVLALEAHGLALTTDRVLLSGGNPQIAKGDGDAPVREYLLAMPGWKRTVGERLDDLIAAAVPEVTRAVRWNSPMYGVPGQGWFLSFHCITKYVKVTFFRGTSLQPLPPIDSKDPHARFLHVFEDLALDEAQFTDWVVQASRLPGWTP